MVHAHVIKTNMDDRHIKKLLLPSFLIAVLSTLFVYELRVVIDQLFFKKKHILVIGILSAPENFKQRISIRKTWLNLLSEISASSYFIIGNEICDVPPYDRPDPYSCTYRPYALPKNSTPETEFTTMKIQRENSDLKDSFPGFIGFGFYVRNSILVTKLGILRELLKVLNTEIQVKLISAFDKKVLASVTFNSEFLEESSEALTKAIKPVRLNANFEAFVKLEAKNIDNIILPNCNFATWKSKPYVIDFIQLWDQDSIMPVSFTKNSCTFLFFNYTILDVENIQRGMTNRTKRLREWQRQNRKLSSKLQNESKVFDDILFVDVVDTYRNLSLKMAKFYKRIKATEYFHYVLKADDDSFIDLLRVHHQLSEISRENGQETKGRESRVKKKSGLLAKLRPPKFWWWSFFKEYWKVERSGKWREDEYRSASYPTFPCGGGYVVNKGIVDYIASSERNLHYFQGEDVSLGIWLSSLQVTRFKNPRVISDSPSHDLQKKILKKFRKKDCRTRFATNKTLSAIGSNLCEWTCSKKRYYNRPLCNKVQLSVESMYDTWTEFINKGFL